MDHLTPEAKPSDRRSLYAGQPIQVLLSINTSFHWGPRTHEGKEKTYKMRFDVEELLDDWLVSGQKRGDFLARVRTVDRSSNSLLNCELGWRDFCRPDHSCGSPPRRTAPAESFSHSSPNRW